MSAHCVGIDDTPPRRTMRIRRGMSLVEVIVAMVILTGVVLVLGGFSGRFAQANGQAHLIITANEIAGSRLDEIHTQPTYASLDLLATTSGMADSIRADNTVFARSTRVKRFGGPAPSDSFDYKVVTVSITHPAMQKVVTKTTAMAAY